MLDVVLLHSRADRKVAANFSAALRKLGFSVWSDFKFVAGEFRREVVCATIDCATNVVVLWTANSVKSDLVAEQASYAMAKNKLSPARIGQCVIPPAFAAVHIDDLTAWTGRVSHDGFDHLVYTLEERGERKDDALLEELSALRTAQRSRSPGALLEFLAKFSSGVFARIVREQWEALAAPAPGSGAFVWRNQRGVVTPQHLAKPAQPTGGNAWPRGSRALISAVIVGAAGALTATLAMAVLFVLSIAPPQSPRMVVPVPSEASAPTRLAESPDNERERLAAAEALRREGLEEAERAHLAERQAAQLALRREQEGARAERARQAQAEAARASEARVLAEAQQRRQAQAEAARVEAERDRAAASVRARQQQLAEAGREREARILGEAQRRRQAEAEAALLEAERVRAAAALRAQQLQLAEEARRHAAAQAARDRVEQETRDDNTFALAERRGTLAAYEEYLRTFASGRHVEEARAARQQAIAAASPGAYDLAQLSPEIRAAVMRARRAETRAHAAAERVPTTESGVSLGLIAHRFENGRRYSGEWSNGAANGVGLLRGGDGEVYAGSWRNSRQEGPGVLRFPDGRRYEGEFAGGRPTRQGVFWDQRGRMLGASAWFAALLEVER